MSRQRARSHDLDLDIDIILDGDGTRITEERAHSIAEEVMRRHYVGRPSLTGQSIVSPEIKARVPADLRDRIRDLARTSGRTTSDIVREALERYLAS